MMKAIETHELVVYMWESNSPGRYTMFMYNDTVMYMHVDTRLYVILCNLLQKTNLIVKMLMLSSSDSMR